MKKTFLIIALFIMIYLPLFSQISSPEQRDTTLITNDITLIEKKVSLLQTVVIVSFSINLILSLAIIYSLQKKSNPK